MSLTAAETRIKAKLPLKVKRFYLNMTQMQLSNLTGINTARISMFETGQLILNEREKEERGLDSYCRREIFEW